MFRGHFQAYSSPTNLFHRSVMTVRYYCSSRNNNNNGSLVSYFLLSKKLSQFTISKSSFSPAYTFTFVSLLSPASLRNVRLFISGCDKVNEKHREASVYAPRGNFRRAKDSRRDFTKILVKQSYLLLVWVSYLAKCSYRGSQADTLLLSEDSPLSQPFFSKKPSIVILPKRSTKLTFLKAPMAHKTFSQEQVSFEFFKLNISFTPLSSPSCPRPRYREDSLILLSKIKERGFLPSSRNAALLLYSWTKKGVPFLSTNLFFLSRLTYSFTFYDEVFFCYPRRCE